MKTCRFFLQNFSNLVQILWNIVKILPNWTSCENLSLPFFFCFAHNLNTKPKELDFQTTFKFVTYFRLESLF
jgi:hypothetical protein